jgi:hypothetical protein
MRVVVLVDDGLVLLDHLACEQDDERDGDVLVVHRWTPTKGIRIDEQVSRGVKSGEENSILRHLPSATSVLLACKLALMEVTRA